MHIIQQHAYTIIIVLFIALVSEMRGWNIFPDLWISAYSGDRGSERGTKFSNKGVTFFRGIGIEKRGVEYSISLSLVK